MTDEEYEREKHANQVVAQVLRKHAALLRQRADSHPDAKILKAGLRDAADLAENTAANLEVLSR